MVARREVTEKSEHGSHVPTVAPYRELVRQWMPQGSGLQQIPELLPEREYSGSYTSVRHFVTALRATEPGEAFARVEVAPGEEAEVDFGSAGRMRDPAQGEVRSAHAFVMTLSHSPH